MKAFDKAITTHQALTEQNPKRTESGFDPGESFRRVASIYARKASDYARKAIDAENQPLFEEYAARAVQFLVDAHKANYFRSPARVTELNEDSDFDLLRNRKDFKDFLDKLFRVRKPVVAPKPDPQ